MTLAQFLDALEQTPRGWKFAYGDRIRRDGLCPLQAVFGAIATKELYTDEWFAVMHAADNDSFHDPALRAQLLQRTGLADQEAR